MPQVGEPLPGKRLKHHVRKDLVLWPHPGMHPFDPLQLVGPRRRRGTKAIEPLPNPDDITPAAVVEWKARVKGAEFATYDKRWLETFTKRYPRTLGVAVSVDFSAGGAFVRAMTVKEGTSDPGWLSL